PLVQKEILDLKDISRPEIWLPSQGHCFRNQVANLCNLINIEERSLPFQFESGSLETIKKLVETEGGFTLLPELATRDMEASKRNQVKEFSDPAPIREVSLVYARNFAKKRVIEVMKKEIAEALPEQMVRGKKGKIVRWK
ncbi:MAG TPA: LysR substrate-binding domain-containing protein, partial [Cytophagaceae bacterium]